MLLSSNYISSSTKQSSLTSYEVIPLCLGGLYFIVIVTKVIVLFNIKLVTFPCVKHAPIIINFDI